MHALQVDQYDTYLRGYQAAAIQTERLAALLNSGQSVILSAGGQQGRIMSCWATSAALLHAVLLGTAPEAHSL